MNRIERIFADLRSKDARALMPFVCGGHPSLVSTAALLSGLERAGAAIVEVGVPFSDPVADGPVIAAAMHRALQQGVTPRGIFEAVGAARPSVRLGLVAMVSASIIHRAGAAAFAKDAAMSGFDGVIVPDLPVEESARILDPFRAAGLTTTLLIAPTTPPERMERIAKACSGFVYLLARVGITGAGAGPGMDASGIAQRVRALRGMTDLPIACGFGIATAQHVQAVVGSDAGGADAAIVGSALVACIDKAIGSGSDPVAAAEVFVRTLAAAGKT